MTRTSTPLWEQLGKPCINSFTVLWHRGPDLAVGAALGAGGTGNVCWSHAAEVVDLAPQVLNLVVQTRVLLCRSPVALGHRLQRCQLQQIAASQQSEQVCRWPSRAVNQGSGCATCLKGSSVERRQHDPICCHCRYATCTDG